MAQLKQAVRLRAVGRTARLAVLGLSFAGCTANLDGGAAGGAGAQPSSTGGSSTAGAGNAAGTSGAAGTPATGGTGNTAGTGTAGSTTDPDGPTPDAPVNPGRVTARRLNRVEYDNTVRDLLGTSLRPAEAFQADAASAGYDTVGEALSLPPAAARDYEAAAYKLVDELLASSTRLATVVPCDVTAQGEACVRTALTSFMRRAYRRPVSGPEVEALLAPYRMAEMLGMARTLGLRHSLAAVLVNPNFLFKLEIDPDPASPAPRRLNDHELATRLSYALWSTMPDDALFAAADAGTLQTDAALTQQIERMLGDPRAAAFSRNFAGQWLGFREANHEPDARVFPAYDSTLAAAQVEEAERFFADFLASQSPLNELLSARFTYVDARLADFYGLPVQSGARPGEMWRADTSAIERSGLLTLGAVLTATSLTTRTSPVKRGEFVLKHVLCATVTPPPADVVTIPDEVDPNEMLTMRQRMEEHRNNDACIGCHAEMDQLGFGLENYDAIGKYRTEERAGLPVDSAGALPDGGAFSGAVELGRLLAADTRFNHCVTKNLMTYAIGRYLNQPDDPTWIAHIAGKTRDTGGQLGRLVRTLLTSETFRSRQAVVAP